MPASTHVKISPPPLWYVSNGDATVGPVRTNTLLRGVSYGRVPGDSYVREWAWGDWRKIEQIREVRSLRQHQKMRGGAWHPSQSWAPPGPREQAMARTQDAVAPAQDRGEVLLLALQAALDETRSVVGLIHRFRSPGGMVTSYGVGPGMADRLGQMVPTYDDALGAACQKRAVMGSQGRGSAQRAVLQRLSVPGIDVFAIAMLPIVSQGRLIAMLEIGRAERRYRVGDKARFEGVARGIAAGLNARAWA